MRYGGDTQAVLLDKLIRHKSRLPFPLHCEGVRHLSFNSVTHARSFHRTVNPLYAFYARIRVVRDASLWLVRLRVNTLCILHAVEAAVYTPYGVVAVSVGFHPTIVVFGMKLRLCPFSFARMVSNRKCIPSVAYLFRNYSVDLLSVNSNSSWTPIWMSRVKKGENFRFK